MHNAGLTYAVENDLSRSIPLLERMLDFNPDDNQGVRYTIGDLYFLNNQFKKAKEIYENNQDYPPYLYSYGLLHITLGNYPKAVNWFRKGILENIYISDYLRMKVPLIPYEVWHGTNYEMPETAYSYIDLMMPKWVDYPEALDLLQFLHIAEISHFQIQQVYALKRELYFAGNEYEFEEEESFDYRGEILANIQKIKNNITLSSSKKLFATWEEGPEEF